MAEVKALAPRARAASGRALGDGALLELLVVVADEAGVDRLAERVVALPAPQTAVFGR